MTYEDLHALVDISEQMRVARAGALRTVLKWAEKRGVPAGQAMGLVVALVPPPDLEATGKAAIAAFKRDAAPTGQS